MKDDDIFVDWAELWAREHYDREWLIDNVLVRGRAHALYAKQKQGKSLLTFTLLAQLATKAPGIRVLYFDYEMTEDDLLERLEDMGYGPQTDLSRLHYALLPPIPPLDTSAGGQRLLAVVDDVNRQYPRSHLVVIIDTTSRAVEGDENSADTIRAFYRHTGIGLKQRGWTWLRIDHAGKDDTKGQRGSSAKGDDVDVVWSLASEKNTDGRITRAVLKRDVSRLSWVPERVVFRCAKNGDLRFHQVADAANQPAGTREAALLLDQLGVPFDASRRVAGASLRLAGHGRANDVVLAAQRLRRLRKDSTKESGPPGDHAWKVFLGTTSGTRDSDGY